jgi:hypothetical protein
MKLSDVEKQVKEIKEKYGDIEVGNLDWKYKDNEGRPTVFNLELIVIPHPKENTHILTII